VSQALPAPSAITQDHGFAYPALILLSGSARTLKTRPNQRGSGYRVGDLCVGVGCLQEVICCAFVVAAPAACRCSAPRPSPWACPQLPRGSNQQPPVRRRRWFRFQPRPSARSNHRVRNRRHERSRSRWRSRRHQRSSRRRRQDPPTPSSRATISGRSRPGTRSGCRPSSGATRQPTPGGWSRASRS
jgi:hypothetical protein